MKYLQNEIIYFHEKQYGKILDIKSNEKYCFEEIIFENFFSKRIDSCYKRDLRFDKNNKLQYYPQGE
jgi:hypothetical protein